MSELAGDLRQMNGIGFPGAPYDHVFFVADTEATGPMVPNELNAYLYVATGSIDDDAETVRRWPGRRKLNDRWLEIWD